MPASERSSTITWGASATTPATGRMPGAGVDEGDGRTVAVADQYGPLDAQAVEEVRQDPERLVVHVTDRPRFGDRPPTARSRSRDHTSTIRPVKEASTAGKSRHSSSDPSPS